MEIKVKDMVLRLKSDVIVGGEWKVDGLTILSLPVDETPSWSLINAWLGQAEREAKRADRRNVRFAVLLAGEVVDVGRWDVPVDELVGNLDEIRSTARIVIGEFGVGRKVVLAGSPVDGMSIFGPFADTAEALTWADRKLDLDQWWLVDLQEKER